VVCLQEQNSVLNALNLLGSEDNIVLIITKEGCDKCIKAKEILEKQDIDYMEIKYETLSKSWLMKLYKFRKANNIEKVTLPILIFSKESEYWIF